MNILDELTEKVLTTKEMSVMEACEIYMRSQSQEKPQLLVTTFEIIPMQ